MNPDVEDLVRHYFNQSFTLSEICGFLLCSHHVMISKRSIRRILQKLGLKRNNVESDPTDIVSSILQLRRLGYNELGYRALWKILNTQCGLRVRQETVRIALSSIDPDGVSLRSRHCLRRRQYISKGPSFIIHLDGYDKLKPFGFAIHGAIDGFSRRILWLSVGPSNNNPRIIAGYYINYLIEQGRVPRLVRCDAGTENVPCKLYARSVAFVSYGQHEWPKEYFDWKVDGKSEDRNDLEFLEKAFHAILEEPF